MYTSFASEAIARRINLLFRITMRHLRLEMKKLGIGAGDYSFLAILHFFPGSSQDELSRHLDVDKSYTARALAKLEKMGLVERRPDPNEHRIRRVHLSQRSKDMEDDFFQVLMNWHHILIKDMDEREVELVRQGMDKMLANARAHMNGPHPSDSPVNFADSEKKGNRHEKS